METKRVVRRKHSKEFRAEVIQSCREPSASVAAIALRSGLNANVVYRWLREDAGVDVDGGSLAVMGRCPDAEFIAVQLPPAAAQSTDMRAGTDTALARVVKVFGAAHPHQAYLFANRRANWMKVLVIDGIGIWLAARRLHQGHFVWPALTAGT